VARAVNHRLDQASRTLSELNGIKRDVPERVLLKALEDCLKKIATRSAEHPPTAAPCADEPQIDIPEVLGERPLIHPSGLTRRGRQSSPSTQTGGNGVVSSSAPTRWTASSRAPGRTTSASCRRASASCCRSRSSRPDFSR
jgi:hypothetical protein